MPLSSRRARPGSGLVRWTSEFWFLSESHLCCPKTHSGEVPRFTWEVKSTALSLFDGWIPLFCDWDLIFCWLFPCFVLYSAHHVALRIPDSDCCWLKSNATYICSHPPYHFDINSWSVYIPQNPMNFRWIPIFLALPRGFLVFLQHGSTSPKRPAQASFFLHRQQSMLRRRRAFGVEMGNVYPKKQWNMACWNIPMKFDDPNMSTHRIHVCYIYMGTFTINIPPMLAYIPYMDPMGYSIF